MIRHVLRKLVEAMKRPGLLGVIGKRREKACQRDLAAYFRLLSTNLPLGELSKLADTENPEIAVHAAEITIRQGIRKAQPALLAILTTNLFLAYKDGWNTTQVLECISEADVNVDAPSGAPLDMLGPTGQRAADLAATNAAELVKQLDERTLELIRDAVAQGIEERLGVDGLARLLRDEIKGMSLDRAKMIATTEMNKAMSTATLEKLGDMNVEYKQWIPVDDPCEICQENAADGAIPVDEEFSSGDAAPPAHPNCRCAVAGARPPKE